MEKFSLDIFTSKVAIGSLWLVSIFLFTCGFYNIYPFVEELSATKTWGAIVTIPTLIFSYVIGGVIIYLNETFLFPISKESKNIEVINYIKIAKTGNESIIKRYEATKYQYDFFSATIPTCIFLGISVIWGSIRCLNTNPPLEHIAVVLGMLPILASYPLYIIILNLKADIITLINSTDVE
ncbi:hypothetical protein GCM10028808_74780 [Spirosoma migulaei]